MPQIQIKAQGIQKLIDKLNINAAIAEYIWNGFDAGGAKIKITFETLNELGTIASISIKDDGEGIEKSKLFLKFKPFYESEKSKEKNHSLPHGHNGYGRFGFIQFSNKAEWQTVYGRQGKRFGYSIGITKAGLENYNDTDELEVEGSTGTTVIFSEIPNLEFTHETLQRSLCAYIKREMGWFLVLRPDVSIEVEDEVLDSDAVIADQNVASEYVGFCIKHEETGIDFDIQYIQWRENPHPEYSKFYYLKENGSEVFKENTRLNNQGDRFYHSVIVKSSLFDDFSFVADSRGQTDLKFSADRAAEEFKFLESELLKFLRRSRKPHLRELSEQTAKDFVKIGAIPSVTEGSSPIERLENEVTREIVEELYRIEPKIFNGFKKEQKLIFGKMLGLMVSNGNMRDDLIKVIGGVVDMSEADLKELSDLLNTLSLQGVTRLAKLVQSRYGVYKKLKEILYDHEKTSLEKDIQLILQDDLWLIDERYTLVTAEEPDFEEALRRVLEFKTGKPVDEDIKIDSPDRQKEMDIFACRRRKVEGVWEHIVVEIKRASKLISKKDADQLYRYMELIRNEKRFNSPDSRWKFYLIGNEYATDEYVQDLKENLKSTGLPDLMTKVGQFEMYALTWSQLLERFEMDHEYLREQLYARSEEILKKKEQDI